MNEQHGENSLHNQVAEVIRKLEALEQRRRALDDELETHANQRVQYQLLGTICSSLDRLEEMGASGLFWGGELAGVSRDKQLQRVREDVAAFEKKIGAIEGVRAGVQAEIDQEEVTLQLLNEELAELQAEAERKAQEFAVEREGVELPYRSYLMPWSKEREDERRYRKIMYAALAFLFMLTGVVELMKKPPEKKDEVVLDEKIAALVVKKKEPPKPPEPKKEEQPAQNASTNANPTAAETQQARAAVQNKGMLAMRGSVSDLLGGSDDAKLGADAHVSNSGKVASGDATPHRSIIGSQAAGGSGGINTTGISGQGVGGGGGGKSITGGGVSIARVESTTAAGAAKDRPLSGGMGPSRTDEDIQIVFDRYKAALYRIYNRELRNDPTLRGKMTLRITIAPDGHVAACIVKSTDLASATLSRDIVAKVLTFNFGAKAGVPTITIIYPIDFLPAT
jgi:outer membrane biosynthesis protein TonB